MTSRRGRSRTADTGRSPLARSTKGAVPFTSVEEAARADVRYSYSNDDEWTHIEQDWLEPNEGPSDDDLPEGLLIEDDLISETPDTGGVSADSLERPGRRVPPADISIWLQGGSLDYSIVPASAVVLRDPLLAARADARADRLDSIGRILVTVQANALRCSGIADAFRSLAILEKQQLSGLLGLTPDGSEPSRERSMLIESPFGLVSLDFFTWATRRWQDRIGAIEGLAHAIEAEPTISDNATARRAADQGSLGADTLRKQVPHVRAVISQPEIVSYHRVAYPLTSWERLREDLALGTTDRGKLVMQMAIVGILGSPQDHS